MDKEYIERFKEFNYELIKTNKDTAPCCSGCAYETRCEKDTSWRGRCSDYAEYTCDEWHKNN